MENPIKMDDLGEYIFRWAPVKEVSPIISRGSKRKGSPRRDKLQVLPDGLWVFFFGRLLEGDT